jgi:hypothetical protein
VGQIGIEHDIIKEIDINPVIISKGKGIAADALMVLESEFVKKNPRHEQSATPPYKLINSNSVRFHCGSFIPLNLGL